MLIHSEYVYCTVSCIYIYILCILHLNLKRDKVSLIQLSVFCSLIIVGVLPPSNLPLYPCTLYSTRERPKKGERLDKRQK
jgi:hypothetical protein